MPEPRDIDPDAGPDDWIEPFAAPAHDPVAAMHTTRDDLDLAAALATPRGVERGVGLGALLGLLGLSAEPVRCGRFTLLHKLGEGAMGEVYRARDPELRRDVAIKLLHDDGPDPAADLVATRMRSEARALARLAHPNVVSVLAIGCDRGRTWIAMELVVGTSMARWCDRPRDADSTRRALAILRAAAEGLAAAHAAGLVHRDFKPANVLVGDDGQVKVADFGLARPVRDGITEGDHLRGESASTARGDRRTRSTALVGTPRYMAPEQCLQRPADARSDQFAFAVSAWEVLTGEPPFVGRTLPERLESILDAAIDPAGATRVPRRLRPVLARALQADPGRRFASMTELLAAWDRATAPRRRFGLALASAASLASLVAVALVPHEPPCDGEGVHRAFAQIWSPARRDTVAAALHATEVPWATAALVELDATLEQRAAAWVDAEVEACEAARTDASTSVAQDRMHACFAHAIDLTSAWLSRLEQATSQMAERAMNATHALPLPQGCDPEQPAPDAEEARLRRELTEAVAADLVGDYLDAARVAQGVADAAEQLGHPRLQAEALLAAAAAEVELRSTGVEPRFDAAHGLAVAEGAHGIAFDAAITAAIWHSRQEHGGEAGRWLRHAEASAARLPTSIRREVALGRARCAVHEANGELEAALAECIASLDRLDTGGKPDTVVRERLRVTIQSLHFSLGHFELALEQSIELRDEAELEHGPWHPHTGGMHLNVGSAAKSLGQYALAEASYVRAAEIFAVAYGDRHRWVASAWLNLGSLRQAQGDSNGAEAAARAALDACGDRRDAATARVLHNLAEARRNLGHADEALQLLERVALIEAEVLPAEHPQTAWTHHSRGNALLDLGRLDEAAAALDAARRVRVRAGSTDFAALDTSVARLEELRAAARSG
jgi:tetratricopeptide (TPR) repeat protein